MHLEEVALNLFLSFACGACCQLLRSLDSGRIFIDALVLRMVEVGVITAGQPYKVLTLSLVSSDSMNSKEVDKILWIYFIDKFAIDLPEDFLLINLCWGS